VHERTRERARRRAPGSYRCPSSGWESARLARSGSIPSCRPAGQVAAGSAGQWTRVARGGLGLHRQLIALHLLARRQPRSSARARLGPPHRRRCHPACRSPLTPPALQHLDPELDPEPRRPSQSSVPTKAPACLHSIALGSPARFGSIGEEQQLLVLPTRLLAPPALDHVGRNERQGSEDREPGRLVETIAALKDEPGERPESTSSSGVALGGVPLPRAKQRAPPRRCLLAEWIAGLPVHGE